jgi:uncharacterized protein YqgV (UPF0045/DUF77 family)
MKLSAEITLYPLQDDYLPVIKRFLEELTARAGVKRETFPTCTVLTGEYDEVLGLIGTMMKWSHENLGKSVFVVKFLPDYEAL